MTAIGPITRTRTNASDNLTSTLSISDTAAVNSILEGWYGPNPIWRGKDSAPFFAYVVSLIGTTNAKAHFTYMGVDYN
jgi:hypothetical protein